MKSFASLVTLILTVIFLTSSLSHSGEMRTWTSKDGKFSIEAELVSDRGGRVTLRKADGKRLTLTANKLSAKDQEFLSSLKPSKTKSSKTNSDPKSSEKRLASAEKALKLLSKKLSSEGLKHPSGPTGECVVYATAGLAFMASGDEGYKGEVTKCYKFLKENIFKKGIIDDPKWDQTTWSYSHTLLFLAEYEKFTKKNAGVTKLAEQLVKELVARQGPVGGWCHGKIVDNALGYRQFVAATNCAVLGLGGARSMGIEIDESVFDKAEKYFKESSDLSTGAVGYSPGPGQKGHGEAGRVGGAIIACIAAGKTKGSFFKSMKKYMLGDLDKVEIGHGSAQLHQLLAGWACHGLGKKESGKFWKLYTDSIIKRQASDGSFATPKGDKMAQMTQRKGGVEDGDRATATHALMLLIPEGHLSVVTTQD